MKHVLFTTALTVLMSLPLAAQQTDDQQQSPDAKIDRDFLETLSDRRLKEIDRNPKKFLETSIRQLFQVAPDGVFDDTLAETARIHATARIRANYISSILEHDLDGDFKIETAEVTRLSTILPPGGKTNLALLMLTADTDGDGTLSTTEISMHAETRMAERPLPRSRNLMEFDVDKDGKVDVQELGRAIRIVENRHQTE